MSSAMFPIRDGPSIPWDLISLHELQAIANHDQTLTRLAERGGLSCCEAVAVLEDRKWHRMNHDNALARLNEIRNADWQSRALAAEQKRDQLKAELQQAREALKGIDLEVQKMGELNGVHYFMDIRASQIRAILERIEKEKK